jgi:uncharacterized protein (TIGR02145 family)
MRLVAIMFFNYLLFVILHSDAYSENKTTVKDIDGNIYKTVSIGRQVWMVENFRATRFNDGTPIPYIKNDSLWAAATKPARCWCDNDSTNHSTYGFLYNGFAATSKKLAPPGWKVPSKDDWQLLDSCIKSNGYTCEDTTGKYSSGKFLASKSNWMQSSNPGAIGNDSSLNNRSGFSAFPGGYRMSNAGRNPAFFGKCYSIGGFGYCWCADLKDPFAAMLSYARNCLEMEESNPGSGYSIRLIKVSEN